MRIAGGKVKGEFAAPLDFGKRISMGEGNACWWVHILDTLFPAESKPSGGKH